MEILLNLLLPQKCVVCGSISDSICTECLLKTKPLEGVIYYDLETNKFIDKKNTKENMLINFMFNYSDVVRDVILKSKYSPKSFNALKKLLCYYYKTHNYLLNDCILVPVPLSSPKYRERGFNQSLLIANYLKNLYRGISVSDILVRGRDTTAQFKNSRNERFKNIRGSIKVSKHIPPSMKTCKVCIVDDICTTGSTLSECYKILQKVGFSQIFCVCVCRSVERF